MDRRMKFSGGIIHWLFLRELHHEGPTYEKRFLFGNHSMRFSNVEFCLITRLHFGIVPDTTRYEALENDLRQRYFGGIDEVSFEDLRVVLTLGEFQAAYDVVKHYFIYILSWILMGLDKRFKIPIWQFQLVGNLDALDTFPWGAHMYRNSICSFKQALDGRPKGFERRRHAKGIDYIRWRPTIFTVYLMPCWPSESEGYDSEPRRVRHMWVQFTTPDLLHLEGIPLPALDVIERRDLDVLEPFDALSFHQIESNFMDLEDTVLALGRMIPHDAYEDITTTRWNVLKFLWSVEDLTMVRGGSLIRTRPWHEVDLVLTLALGDCRPHHRKDSHTGPLKIGSRSAY
ncbi:hypothetical protein Ddye_009127 [Dipteronia dyeriana]|uniref:DUF1985 domain-containing protein n=1 Tax=Dipteronia dyeriana TaxID=168575 RepID=A0AAD9XB23_9ROSI|nr:hypothetical protein Ddye_009127 [Dipteronia dyeriana]